MKSSRLLLSATLLALGAVPLSAQVPNLVSYQGRVAVGTTNFQGTGQFKFALVNAAGTTTYWSNNGTSIAGSQPTAAVSLTVTKGLYSLLLGDTALANMQAVPASVWNNADVRLRIWFNDGTTGFQLLTPDQRLSPNGYLPDGAVNSAKIADGAVSSAKIAAGAVGTAQLGSNLTLSGTFSGNGAGLTALNAAQVTTGTLPLSTLDADVARRSGGNIFAGNQVCTDGLRLPDKDVYFRGGSDTNHGLGWYGSGRQFGSADVNGPVLYGWNGGALGYLDSTIAPPLVFKRIALRWDNAGNVTIQGKVGVPDSLGIGVTNPGAPLDIGITSTRRLRVKTDTNSIPLIEAVSTDSGDGLAGYMRLRHVVEIWPKADGSAAGRLDVRDTSGNPVITLDGASGESTVKVLNITGGADIAEPFHMSGDVIPKGAVVVIDEKHPGQLRMSDSAYDTKVAGIVSGANGINPGLALHQQGMIEGGQNVALTGRVHAMADATGDPIQPGDLLTTSATPGHVMKAGDRERRNGAVIGKAMSSLTGGTGFVLVLVNLQ